MEELETWVGRAEGFALHQYLTHTEFLSPVGDQLCSFADVHASCMVAALICMFINWILMRKNSVGF